MPGQGTVEDVVRCLNFAQDVGKQIKAAGYQLEKADMKMLLADLTAAVASAKMELSLLQGVCEARDAELIRMNEVLVFKGNLRRRGDGYYKTLDGRPYGQPYCSYCWEGSQKLLHLHSKILSRDVRVCPGCKNEYQAARTPYLEADGLMV
ncbi:hypothetical protein GJQ55_04805 [Venatoribacter cucullus]|uniref:Uncharacterized protein n=1 Tax=Venatoribacter cucullus TaxID=2661630 RepID=A0A9X7UVU9_9GAMM|nr:hypothetical protein [Venatoribacter cucullus]QQD21057.1 hypothetical protein GJQ54_04405 [Oceanospirillaceae bacterium ASx5O]QQD23840.1 hypothetical protein GJQ55_04805 [Venatoribacter cucullus]